MGIYGMGKAFNLRYANSGQFRPTIRYGGNQRQPIMFGGGSVTTNTNITIKNGPTGFWGFMSGLFGGLFGGGMMNNIGMCGNPLAFLNNWGVQGTRQSQQSQAGDRLADLQKMFPDWNITSDGNGNYDAVNKEGTVHEKGNFDEMCDKLLKKNGASEGATTPDTSTPTTSTPTGSTPAGSTPTESTPTESTQTGSTPVGEDTVKGGTGAGVRRRTTTSRTGGAGAAVQAHNEASDKPIDKTKPQTVNIKFKISTMIDNSGSATVTMPDGSVFKAETGMSWTHNSAMNALADDIMKQLKNAGWTNVTLVNPNFKFQKGGQANQTEGANRAQGSQEAGKPTNWTAEEKAKPRTLNISFSIHTTRGNYGHATVTTPDGKTHKVTTSMSLTQQRAMEDLSKQMKEALSNAGWTNVTLVNQNFNWSD